MPAEPTNAVVHFYRATVMHADVWRQRLDATTNWAVVSSAALISFAFTGASHPHFILLLALAVDMFFLAMESRRYQTYDLWRHRIRTMNRYIIAPALSPNTAPPDEEIEASLTRLSIDLGSTIPRLTIIDAMGYRLRRNYLFLTLVMVGTWLLKLWYHPTTTRSFAEMVARAEIGIAPGWLVMVLTGVVTGIAIWVALRAPTEKMEEWVALPPPFVRLLPSGEEDPDDTRETDD